MEDRRGYLRGAVHDPLDAAAKARPDPVRGTGSPPRRGHSRPSIGEGWRFSLVDDAAIKAQLAPLNRQGFERLVGQPMGASLDDLRKVDGPLRRVIRSSLHVVHHFHEVPLLLLGFDQTRDGAGVYPALWSAMLAARAEGTGAPLTGMLQVSLRARCSMSWVRRMTPAGTCTGSWRWAA